MTGLTFILRSLRFHARAHAGTVLGAAVGSAVLVGALVVGDSVRESLRRFALLRLGKTDIALSSGDRFFRTELGEKLIDSLDNVGAVALQLPATATAEGGARRANRVQLLGVDPRFWNLSEQAPSFDVPAPGDVILNKPLAEQLGAQTGDSILLRVPKPSRLSREAPISPQEDFSAALRATVRAVASDAEFGRFSLQASQVAPFNAFVSMAWLQEQLKLPGRANLFLMAMDRDPWAPATAAAALRKTWQLADAELELREIPEAQALELRTSRVFLDAPIAEAALKAASNACGVLTYFVNELRVGNATTPYSMVTASSPPIIPRGLREEGIFINQWLADDLKARPGDELSLTYYVVGTMRKLEERTDRFRIQGVVPMDKPFADRSLMPDFPGMVEAKDCRDWDTGFPIALDKIREQDNKYWEDHRGTPKAFITLAAGQEMWANRFGNLTAVRYPLGAVLPDRMPSPIESLQKVNTEPGLLPGLSPPIGGKGSIADAVSSVTAPVPSMPPGPTLAPERLKEILTETILRTLDPASIGLRFEPVRQQAVAAASQAQDFGQLFLGFSFFLIVAALLLMALLFQFGIEQRATEVGTLLALGFTPKQVRRLFTVEGGALALMGGLIGVIGGAGYARAMLHGLATVWRGASGTSALAYHAEPLSLLAGGLAGALVGWFTIWLVVRKQAQQTARELLSREADFTALNSRVPPHPGPLPPGEGKTFAPGGPIGSAPSNHTGGSALPLPRGEGRGEGKGNLVQAVSSSAGKPITDRTARWTTPRMFVVPPSGGPDRLKPGLQTHGCRPSHALLGKSNHGLKFGWGGLILALIILILAVFRQGATGVGEFFGAGAMLLISGLGFAAALLAALTLSEAAARPNLTGMGVRNATRRRKRSLATIGLLASGSFMIVAVGVFRLDSEGEAQKRSSGTGGFALIGESTLPIVHDLNAEDGRQFFGLSSNELAGVEFVALRVRDGEEASCLNLNRAQKPRLLGVQPELLNQRNAFAFAAIAKGLPKEHPWLLLKSQDGDTVPAIGDQASIQWALGKKVGDTLEYTDDRGQSIKLRLVASVANSILQGNLLIAEEEFLARFERESGYRMFLVDAPSNTLEKVSASLGRALRDVGLELTPAARRLAAFNAVQNTYLSTFQVLGGLGLLLGSVGLGVVVLRNVMERRGELALLLAVGFRPRVLRWVVMSEHGALLLSGLGIGLAAALVAVLPTVLLAGSGVPFASLALMLAAVLASGIFWTWLATFLALRGRLLDALRAE